MVGEEERTPFWLEKLIGDKPLKLVYPILYQLSKKLEIKIA